MTKGEKSANEWGRLIEKVKCANCGKCNRRPANRGDINFKVLIDRPGSTRNIKYVFVSQDPASFYTKPENSVKFPNSERIEDSFVKSARKEGEDGDYRMTKRGTPKKSNVLNLAARIIDRDSFDPSSDEVYWTHALKCPPLAPRKSKDATKSNQGGNPSIIKDWPEATKCREEFLKNEFETIQSPGFTIVAIGGCAYGLCRDALGMAPGKSIDAAMNDVANRKRLEIPDEPFAGKTIALAPLIHPSYAVYGHHYPERLFSLIRAETIGRR